MANQEIKILSKFLDYVLARHPDEFGLLLDERGFCKIKTLLQALHEDPEWRHVRQGQLNSLILIERPAPIEMEGNLIRAVQHDYIPDIKPASDLPKLLYTAVRQRAYPVILDKGLKPGGVPYILLCAEQKMAMRLGRRLDNAPILLTIQVAAAQKDEADFFEYGTLFLAKEIAPAAISGPPLPKDKAQTPQASPTTTKNVAETVQPKTPGTFIPDIVANETPHQRKSRREEKQWKKDRRQARKEKHRQKW